MFKKILIAEDQEVMNLGIVNALTELNITHFDFVSYCDDALEKIKAAALEKSPYDLLITDLSFQKDHIPQNISSGQELIHEAKEVQPDLKVVVFSVEKRPKAIDDLYKIHKINGFVSKARNDGKDLKSTIRKVFTGETVISQEILNAIRNTPVEFDSYDIKLLELLAKGYRQNEIGSWLKENDMKAHSIRSIEKRLSELRESVGAKNNIEMVVICKDLGIL